MKKLFVFLLLGVFLISFTSAGYNFDNTLRYEKEDMKVTIENVFGLPLFGSDLGTAELKSHKSVNHILKVAPGNDRVVMYYDLNFNEVYRDGLGDVEFINMETEEEIEKDYHFVIWDTIIEEKNNYSTVCNDVQNGTNISQVCEQIFEGTYLEEKEGWVKLDIKDIPKGQVRIGLVTDVNLGETIDGVWTIAGKKIKKHAVWTADLNVGLVSYYKLDGSSGAVLDSLNINSGTNNGATRGIGGIINNSFSFITNDYVDCEFIPITDTSFSWAFWINSTMETGFIMSSAPASGNSNGIGVLFSGGKLGAFGGGGGSARWVGTDTSTSEVTSLAYNDNNWHFVVLTFDGANGILYVDNSSEISSTWTPYSSNHDLYLATRGGVLTGFYDGLIDEVGIWNRTLSQAEVTQLYNGSNGITWTDQFKAIDIVLNSPADNISTTNTTINFNSTINALELEIVSVTLSINGLANQTNFSGVEGDYIFSETLSTGDYNWSISVVDNESNITNSEIRSLTIDATVPQIDVESPIGEIDFGIIGMNETLNVTFIDDNLDSCWYNYNGTNISIDGCTNGTKNSTEFILEDGILNMTLYANDTVGNFNSSFISWNYNILQLNETFSTETTETSSEDFETWVSFNGTLWNSISALLNYDGINYSSIQSSNENQIQFISTIDIPPINNSEQNNTFSWIFILTNSTSTHTILSKENNQTVKEISVEICEIGETPYIIFDTRNAENPFPSLNATFKSAWTISIVGADVQASTFAYEDITEANNSWQFCISPNSSNYTISIDIETDATGFAKNFYYIQNADYISNETQNISLYLLNDSLATPTTLEVKDRYQVPITEALIFIQLYDIGTDIFYTVGMAKTDLNGKDTQYLNWFDSLYKFVITKDGEIIYTEEPRKVYEDPTKFTVEDTITYDFDKFQDFEYTLFYNNETNNFVLTYIKPSAEVEQGCLRVIRRTATNDDLICQTCSLSASATLYCNIANSGNGTFLATFYATGSLAVIDWISQPIGIGISESIFTLLDESDSAFYTFLLTGLVMTAFLINIVFGIIGLLLGLLAASTLGFTIIQYEIFLTISVVGGIIIWLIKR